MLQTDEDVRETISHPLQQSRTLRIAGLITLAVAAASVATGLVVRWRHELAVKQWTVTAGCPFCHLRHADGRWLRLAVDPAR